MQILLDSNSVALYFGGFVVKDNCIDFSAGCNWEYNSSNTSVIETDPPEVMLPNLWKWENSAWTCLDQSAVDAYLQGQKNTFNAAQKQRRVEAYRNESDPLFFMAQRGQGTMEDWTNKVAEIVARYPYQS